MALDKLTILSGLSIAGNDCGIYRNSSVVSYLRHTAQKKSFIHHLPPRPRLPHLCPDRALSSYASSDYPFEQRTCSFLGIAGESSDAVHFQRPYVAPFRS